MKRLVNGVEVDLTPQEVAERRAEEAASWPTFEQIKAAELSDFDTRRDKHLNRLTGVGFRASARGEVAAVTAIVAASDALLDLPTHSSVTAATDITTLKTAIRSREAEIFNSLPTAVKAVLKKIG